MCIIYYEIYMKESFKIFRQDLKLTLQNLLTMGGELNAGFSSFSPIVSRRKKISVRKNGCYVWTDPRVVWPFTKQLRRHAVLAKMIVICSQNPASGTKLSLCIIASDSTLLGKVPQRQQLQNYADDHQSYEALYMLPSMDFRASYHHWWTSTPLLLRDSKSDTHSP